jgi:putative hydrolase of the HAD superfamily
MSKYKAIIFDLYGTLLDIHTDEEKDSLWRRLAYFYCAKGAIYSETEIKSSYLQLVEAELQQIEGVEYPDFDILKVFERLFTDRHILVDDQELLEVATLFRLLSLDYVKPYDGALELLRLIRCSSFKLILLTNAQRAFTVNELKATQLIHYFDSIYISSDFEASKPEAKFFDAMLCEEGLEGNQCLFIGNDHRTDIKGANLMGMDTIYVHTNCSPSIVPKEIDATWRVDSGNLIEVMEIIREITLTGE